MVLKVSHQSNCMLRLIVLSFGKIDVRTELTPTFVRSKFQCSSSFNNRHSGDAIKLSSSSNHGKDDAWSCDMKQQGLSKMRNRLSGGSPVAPGNLSFENIAAGSSSGELYRGGDSPGLPFSGGGAYP